MTKTRKVALGIAVVVAAVAAGFLLSPKLQFLTGGALVNMGYRMQDHIHAFDMAHEHSEPGAIWAELQRQNELAASVRDSFPRSSEHPVVALLVCMDARIDTSELVGDTRRYYYIVRTAGSALAEPEQEMLELAVVNGVEVIVLTTHTDCAAEGAAADPELRERFPAVVELVDQREERIREFMARPIIHDAIAAGRLRIERARIDTQTDRLMPEPPHHGS
ncbi:MAG: hypothetical protein H6719_11160 [Sandaracinaceae bacterium]|nr:hypothetical protein [Sandaracinaceae bacterium]